MLAVTSPDVPGDRIQPGTRATFPLLTVGATLGAALALAGVGAVTRQLGGDATGPLAGAIVALLAGLLTIFPIARTAALLLAWNALGIGCALFVIGIFSVGALSLFPLALLGIALAAWPRQEGEPVVSGPAIAVLVTGFLLVTAFAGLATSDLWAGLRALVGV